MTAPVLQFKRGLLANLPGLRAGEPGFTTDSYDLFVGLTSETSTNKFFGSHRYWTKETTSTGSGLNLVEGTSSGSDYITIKSPDSLAGIVTYTLPGIQGAVSSVLTNDGSGNLTWSSNTVDLVFIGIATFTDTTDNTLGDSDTGSVQIDGGLGIDKNITVGANLNVQGYSEFVGVSTFGSDLDINASADISTNLSVGQNLSVTGVSTFTGAIDVNGGGSIDNVQIGVSGDNEIDTSSGNLTIDSAGGTTTIDDDLIVSGDVRINGNDIQASDGTTAITMSSANVTVGGDLTVGGNDIKASDGTTALTLADSTGAVTAASDLTVSGNLYVSGNTTQVNTAALTVEDRTIDLGIVNGAAPAAATTWDLGVLFNYYTGGAAKKSAVVWEHGDTRFKFASVLGADSDGTDANTPQLTVTTFAPIEIGALWVTDCAGTSQVISCTGTERFLENITVDAGQF